MTKKEKLKNFILKSKVFENYFFMTLLQGFSSLIGIIIYPYLIRKLGGESYGLYIFSYSNISFFIAFISFGFTFPALKKISLHMNDRDIKENVLSSVFTAKFYLFIFSAILLGILIMTIPFLRNNYLVYLVIFSLAISEILFPIWYFQGIQKMKLVTYIQLSTKLLTIPFIFVFIKSPDDLLVYAIIISAFTILGAIISIIYIRVSEKIHLHFVPFGSLKILFEDSLPFFWTSTMSTIKKETVTLIIGSFFGMKDVALYDLANKIIMIPRLITMNINDAIFPKLIHDIKSEGVKKIIHYERIISLVIIFIIIVFGYWAILLLGGKEMIAAYPLAIILSFTIYTWLIVGCYIYYVFVPQNKYYFVTKNQFVALISFAIFCIVGLFVYKSLLLVVLAFTLSGIVEIFYCKYLIKKHQLL